MKQKLYALDAFFIEKLKLSENDPNTLWWLVPILSTFPQLLYFLVVEMDRFVFFVTYALFFLAHLSRRLEWAIVIAHRPSSVRP